MDDIYVEGEGFSEAEYGDVTLCVRTLLSIREGEQPLEREMGVDYERAVSYPPPVARAALTVEIMDKIERYEPRVRVESVTYGDGTDGRLIPRVRFVKREGRDA